MNKQIDIVIVSRADLYPLLTLINKKKIREISFRIILTGSLLTKNQIKSSRDVKKKYQKIHFSNELDKEFDIIKNISKGITKFSNFYKKRKPNAILVLGDRFELLVIAIISIIYGIPIIHVHGGEITEGSFDNTIRHCISKIASLHFVSNNRYKKRLIQMGEQPKNIFVSGAPGLEFIHNNLNDKKFLEKKYKFKFKKKNILFTLHPETISKNHRKYIKNFIKFLSKNSDYFTIFTSSNLDTDYKFINESIKKYIKNNINKAKYIKNLGNVDYKSMVNSVDCVVGNSSSGIIEVPSLKKPTINIGERQKGRIFSKSVININGNYNSIKNSILKSFTKEFKKKTKLAKNPYYKKNSSGIIINNIKKFTFNRNYKKFYDL